MCTALCAQTAKQAPAAKPTAAPVYGYKIVRTYPHDRTSFTEGFFVLDGQFWESTGLEGRSYIRRIDIESGRVLQQYNIPSKYFGEGIVIIGNQLFELTYKHGLAFVYDKSTFQLLKTFQYSGEGWALTTDGKNLIFDDGSSVLKFLDPATFKEVRRITVTDAGQPVDQINELEYIKGEIWANIWQEEKIARIDPRTGKINSWLDMRGLLSVMESVGTDVLNGIAYDAKTDRIFVTGKFWPKVFEITVGPKK
jgi:glutamine cyclotransferase